MESFDCLPKVMPLAFLPCWWTHSRDTDLRGDWLGPLCPAGAREEKAQRARREPSSPHWPSFPLRALVLCPPGVLDPAWRGVTVSSVWLPQKAGDGSQCITGWQSRQSQHVISIHLFPNRSLSGSRRGQEGVGGEEQGKVDGVGADGEKEEGGEEKWEKRGKRTKREVEGEEGDEERRRVRNAEGGQRCVMMKEGVREKAEGPKRGLGEGSRGVGGTGEKGDQKGCKGMQSVHSIGHFCQGTQAGGSSGRGAERREARRLQTTSSFIFLFSQSWLVPHLLGGPRANARSRRWSSEGHACVRWGSRRPQQMPL